jgi:hypothetical protein
MKIQQEAHKVLELAKVCQTRVSPDHLKPALPLDPEQDTFPVRSTPYLKALEKNVKITSLWIGPCPVLEGPDDKNNYKVEFGSMMSSVYPWVARSQLKPYLFSDKYMYLSEHFTRPGPL